MLFVVDDDESVRKALRRLFQCVGLRTEAFASAEEFLARPPSTSSCCLILDVHLPGMSGLDLQMKLNAEHRHLQILFLTGDMDESLREKAMTQGALEFITKPFKEKTMLDAVARALNFRSPVDRLLA